MSKGVCACGVDKQWQLSSVALFSFSFPSATYVRSLMLLALGTQTLKLHAIFCSSMSLFSLKFTCVEVNRQLAVVDSLLLLCRFQVKNQTKPKQNKNRKQTNKQKTQAVRSCGKPHYPLRFSGLGFLLGEAHM